MNPMQYARPEAQLINPDDIYIVSIQSIDDPINIRKWSVNINMDHFEGPCNKQCKVPGKVINTLYDAAVEKEEHQVMDSGMLRPTGNFYRESRWAVRIYGMIVSDSKPIKEINAELPVEGMVLKSRFDDMTLEEMRKIAREKLKANPDCGLNSQTINYANKKMLTILLTSLEV